MLLSMFPSILCCIAEHIRSTHLNRPHLLCCGARLLLLPFATHASSTQQQRHCQVRVHRLLLEAKCCAQQLPERVQGLLLVAVYNTGAAGRRQGPLEVRQHLLQAVCMNLQSAVQMC